MYNITVMLTEALELHSAQFQLQLTFFFLFKMLRLYLQSFFIVQKVKMLLQSWCN